MHRLFTNVIIVLLFCMGINVAFAESIQSQQANWVKSGDGKSYTNNCGTFKTFQYNPTAGSLNGYTLSVIPPSGWSFKNEDTKASAGGLEVKTQGDTKTGTGNVKKLTLSNSCGPNYAMASVCIAADSSPVSFTLTLSGTLTASGSGGTAPTWSAIAATDFYYINPHELFIAFNNSTTKSLTAKRTSQTEAVSSTWEANPTWQATTTEPILAAYSQLTNKDSISIGHSGDWNPPANDYTITATATIDGTSRSENSKLYVVDLKNVEVKKKGTGGRPSSGLVVKTSDQVTISVSVTPSTIVGDKVSLKWYIRQMGSSGSYGSWANISSGDDETSFDYTSSAGIFQLKAEMELPDDSKIIAVLERTSDDAYSDLQKGDSDAFGVVAGQWQIDFRNKAVSNLGSTLWACNVQRTHTRPLPDTVWPARGAGGVPEGYKCNLFVCEMGDGSNVTIPLINGTIPRYPPLANEWATSSFAISKWSVATGIPLPGYTWALFRSGESGHCGIVDYDGRIISAGGTNVNRNETRINNTRRKYTP